jgi:hypothetical protein
LIDHFAGVGKMVATYKEGRMGHTKDFHARIRGGGDDAVAALEELLNTRDSVLKGITDTFAGPRWITVSERLPELEEKVLVAGGSLIEIGWREHFANYTVPTTEWTLGEELDAGEHPKWITHWMPLPAPPAD